MDYETPEKELEQMRNDLEILLMDLNVKDCKTEQTLRKHNNIDIEAKICSYYYKDPLEEIGTIIFKDSCGNMWLREESKDVVGWGCTTKINID